MPTRLDAANLEELLAFALHLASVAQRQILPRFQDCSVKIKADGTEVTDADRAAEEAIRDEIHRAFPEHGVLGEEFGETAATGDAPRWVIDPIDGTAAFTLGLPNFGTLVSLVEGNEPVLGVIHLPAIGETTYAARGSGCWLRRRGVPEPAPVRVSPRVPVRAAVASATGLHNSDLEGRPERLRYRLSGLLKDVWKFRFVGDCLQHALLCRGRVHIAIDVSMAPWDIAALVPCVEEAGGVATTLDGKRENLAFTDSLLTTCHPELHREVIDLLRTDSGRE